MGMFEPGDTVTCAYFGEREFVLMDAGPQHVEISVETSMGAFTVVMTKDGRAHSTHTHPILTLVSHKQKQVIEWLWEYSYPMTSWILNLNWSTAEEMREECEDKNGIIYRISSLCPRGRVRT